MRYDGVQSRCRACDRVFSKKSNPDKNAVSRLAYKMAGGFEAYRSLPHEERMAHRESAKKKLGVIPKDRGASRRTEVFRHPMLSRYRFENRMAYEATDRKVSSLRKGGFVYVIEHPMYPGFSKVGRSSDPEKRLISANTWCPDRGYTLYDAVHFDNVINAEAYIHRVFEPWSVPDSREWYSRPATAALKAIQQMKEEGTIK